MKDLPNTDSGLFPKKSMNKHAKEKPDIVERAAEILKIVLNRDEIESVNVKYTKDKFDMSFNFKENEK